MAEAAGEFQLFFLWFQQSTARPVDSIRVDLQATRRDKENQAAPVLPSTTL